MKGQKDSSRVTRRQALKGIAAGAAVAAAGPNIIRAADSEKRSTIVLGSGRHAYELVENWGELPKSMSYANNHGLCEDSQGRIYVHHTNSPSMVVFDADGKFVKSWGEKYAGGAHGLQYSKEKEGEFLYLATTGLHTVVKTTLDGEVVFELGYPKESKIYDDKPESFVPTNIAIAPNGDFYVADGYGRSWIHRYDAKGKYVSSFGGPGKEDGQLACPHGIAIDTRGPEPTVLVADRSNVRLQWFTLDGKFIKKVGDELRHPCHFDQAKNGDLLIPDLHGRVTIFDKDNKLVAHLGDNTDPKRRGVNFVPHEERKAGVFISPHGAIWSHTGDLYVGEWIRDGRLTKLRRVS